MYYFVCLFSYFFFFKQKTAYEMRISDWSSDVCSSDLVIAMVDRAVAEPPAPLAGTRWDVDTLISGELVESVPEAVDAYLTFDGEGGIAGQTDRKSVGEGKSVSVRVILGGRRIIKKKKTIQQRAITTTKQQNNIK